MKQHDNEQIRGVNKMGLHIVLHEPEIPANTGNIARTCVATNTTLHLIHPLGFSTKDRMLKRAGLDYWEHLSVYEYKSMEQLHEKYQRGLFYYIEDVGETYYTDVDLSEQAQELFFVFGKETAGLPSTIIEQNKQRCLRIYMSENVRSLNLSNAVAVVIYEALRQQNFRSLI